VFSASAENGRLLVGGTAFLTVVVLVVVVVVAVVGPAGGTVVGATVGGLLGWVMTRLLNERNLIFVFVGGREAILKPTLDFWRNYSICTFFVNSAN